MTDPSPLKLKKSQTVLVTGATGFLGSHLVQKFVQDGHHAIVLKRSFSDTWRLNSIMSKIYSYNVDKCDLQQPFKDFEIDVIVHAATNYGRNNETNSSILNANLLFPVQLLEIASLFNVNTFFNTDTILSKESNKYALSKKQFLEWGQLLASTHKIRFVNIRLEHMFGEGDDDSKFTSYAIKNCLKNVPELKLTLGEQKRDFIYVRDVVSAYSLLLTKVQDINNFYQDYHLGSGKAVSIKDFVHTVHNLSKSQTLLNFGAIPYRENEIMHSEANLEALQNLGWQPMHTLESGLSQTIFWYLQQ